MRIEYTTTVDPATFLGTATVRQFLRLEHTEEDTLLEALRSTAVSYVEEYTNTKLGSVSATAYLDSWRSQEIPVGPVTAVSGVTYKPAGYSSGDLSAFTNFHVDTDTTPARIRFVDPPNLQEYAFNRVRIAMTVGYAADDIPAPMLQAVRLLIGHLYENRTAEVVGNYSSPLILGVHALCNPFRIFTPA